ncbi:hypothetical protein APR41_08070 [Salegentibacter salinarum]|uniref:Uncharacterized protein n=1 Tax=Salegentibacter salinarum TaxID=447422 RepID=A0A2N0TPU5_9FLAO|nr:hypothetical protein [Salegentibacter salinarum]PKD16752.1 hypothetical protein APR41_08070 [Salegentibacter salinarum]SKB59615.1 hypothetical protein SAMN05660903_01578 [Salegentibacter salinarum]
MAKSKIDLTNLSIFFAEWEKQYPVETWEVGGVHVWPIIKKKIFFITLVKGVGQTKRPSLIYSKIFNKVRKLVKAWVYIKKLKLEEATFLFSSIYEQRIIYKNKEFNRFIEPLMDYLEGEGENSYFLEYPVVKENCANRPDRIVDINSMLPLYSSSRDKNRYVEELKQLPEFEAFLESVHEKTGIDARYHKNKLIRTILSIKSWEKVYTKIIKLTKPKYAVSLVYYSDAHYGFNLAARKLGVSSIDLQHGGLGKAHPAYYFSKIPVEGYNILPNIFWVWSKSSYKDINIWTNNTPHKTLLGGNPWIGFLKQKKKNNIKLQKLKPVVLFTLQPINDIIPSYLYKVIEETKEEFEWWLRFHPRMSEMEKKSVEDKFKDLGILENITIEYSSSAPLPLVLEECDLHLSFSSGSITEAAILQRFSLILSETGINYYKNLIEEGWAFPCKEKDIQIIKNKIRNILDQKRNLVSEKEVDYRETLKLLLKQN